MTAAIKAVREAQPCRVCGGEVGTDGVGRPNLYCDAHGALSREEYELVGRLRKAAALASTLRAHGAGGGEDVRDLSEVGRSLALDKAGIEQASEITWLLTTWLVNNL